MSATASVASAPKLQPQLARTPSFTPAQSSWLRLPSNHTRPFKESLLLPRSPARATSTPYSATVQTKSLYRATILTSKRSVLKDRKKVLKPMASHSVAVGAQTEVQQVRVTNKQGEALAGLVDEAGSEAIVVLCHGFRDSKTGGVVSAVAKGLNEAGLSTFRFDFSGNGESEGSFEYGNYMKEVEDLRAVVEHWRSAGRQVAAIAGHSKGGNDVILYAAKYDDIPLVLNISGRFDTTAGDVQRFGAEGLKTMETDGFLDIKDSNGVVKYRVTWESLLERKATDMRAACEKMKSSRVITIHGSADDTIPVADAHSFAASIDKHSLHVIEAANHNYTKHRTELARLVTDCIVASVSST